MQAIAENAVIVSDNGYHVSFHPRCPNCGKVHETVTSGVGCTNGTIASAGSFTCWQCRKSFQIRIMKK